MRLATKTPNRYTVQPVFKDHPWEENNLVFVHMWPLIAGSCMQEMNNWGEFKNVVAIDRELPYKGGRKHRFECICIAMLSEQNAFWLIGATGMFL